MNYIDDYKEGNPKIKKNLPWILIAILVIAVGVSIWINMRPGISVEGIFLYRKSAGHYVSGENEIKMTHEGESTSFDMKLYGESKSAELTWEGETATITFDDGESVSGTWGYWNQEECLLNEEDFPIALNDSFTVVVGDDIEQNQISNKVLAENLCKLDLGKTEAKGYWAFIIIGTIGYLLGLACFYFPEETALLFSRWKYDYVELSDMALFAEKAGGVLVMIIGVLVILHIVPL